jgi:hypothetical protein
LVNQINDKFSNIEPAWKRYYYRHQAQRQNYRRQYYQQNSEKEKQYSADHTKKSNHEAITNYAQKRHQYLLKIKTDLGRAICGTHIKKLLFHHLDPNDKDFEMSEVSKSFPTIDAELAKCIVLCFGCHTKLHAAKGDYKRRFVP